MRRLARSFSASGAPTRHAEALLQASRIAFSPALACIIHTPAPPAPSTTIATRTTVSARFFFFAASRCRSRIESSDDSGGGT
jgi:hypothetical protein